MKEFVCTTCPNGCTLQIDDINLTVSGNKCPRGETFAKQELTCPKRTICSSVKTTVPFFPVVSVKTNGEVDKKLIMKITNELSKIVINRPLPIGSVVVKNILGTGVDIITTKDMK